jgi:hypothetical protein
MKMGPTRPETSVNNYHTTPYNYPEDHRLHQHRGWKPEIKNKKVGKEKKRGGTAAAACFLPHKNAGHNLYVGRHNRFLTNVTNFKKN